MNNNTISTYITETINTYIVDTNNNDTSYTNNSISNQLNSFLSNLNSKNNIYYSTGIIAIDKLLNGGLSPSTLNILGGLCGMGKTTLALQIAWYISSHYQKDVLFLAAEMSEFQLQLKLISNLTAQLAENTFTTPLTYDDIRMMDKWDTLNQDQADLLIKALAKIKENNHLYIKSIVGKTSVEQIKNYIETHIKETGNAPVIFLDYLQNVKEPSASMQDKQIIDNAVYMLNGIAHEYSVPVVALSSLGRSAYSSPSISAAKGSGEIEYTASNVILLTNVDNKQPTTAPTRTSARTSNRQQIGTKVLASAVKNRFGSSQKSCELIFVGQYNIFKENR